MTLSTSILKDTARLFAQVRKDIFTAAQALYLISSRELWKGEYASFGAYVEQECQISPSFAAKLIAVWGHYIVEGKVGLGQLRHVDSEKLYLAMRLPLKAEEQLLRAQSWTRGELKAELASRGGVECDHESQITICARCHAKIV